LLTASTFAKALRKSYYKRFEQKLPKTPCIAGISSAEIVQLPHFQLLVTLL
jgi:hypothetical protein